MGIIVPFIYATNKQKVKCAADKLLLALKSTEKLNHAFWLDKKTTFIILHTITLFLHKNAFHKVLVKKH